MFHSFTRFHRNAIAAASLFLAAKVKGWGGGEGSYFIILEQLGAVNFLFIVRIRVTDLE